MQSRRPDIDWLRVIATYLLFVFHVGKVFDPAPFFHIRNGDLSLVALIVCGFISLWHMPLFFVLAGWSAAQSLASRGTRGFVAERIRRLAIPLVAGCVLLAPVIKYFELRSGLDLNHTGFRMAANIQEGIKAFVPGGLPVAPPFSESFSDFLPTFFIHLDRFTWAHLWFVAYLLTFTMVYLPVFIGILRLRDRLQCVGAAVLYLPLLPLLGIQLTLRSRWPGIYNLYNDWANVAYYSVFLLAGFALATQPALERRLRTEWRRSLSIGGAVTVGLLLSVLEIVPGPSFPLVGTAIAGWCFVLAFVGLANEVVHETSLTLSYLSESAFPVYVLHQAAIVVPGYFLVTLPLGIATKFTLLVAVSLAITLATYEWLIRPFVVPRFLLGLKPLMCPLRQTGPLTRAAVPLGMVLLAAMMASPASANTPTGLWYAEGGAAQVAIEPCGEQLCGRVKWLRSPFDESGCDLQDRNNPDPTLQSRRVEGLKVLWGLRRGPGETWDGGNIYDPGSGSTYTCTLAFDGPDRLRLRGYVGIPLIGRTTTWIRVGSENRMCRGDRQ
jgi:glucans biosynthesis protein C